MQGRKSDPIKPQKLHRFSIICVKKPLYNRLFFFEQTVSCKNILEITNLNFDIQRLFCNFD